MEILMFGWEFPPYNSGGLGVACEALVKELANQKAKIIFVLPKKINCKTDFCKIVFADSSLKIKAIDSPLIPYLTSAAYGKLVKKSGSSMIYNPGLFGEVIRYAQKAKKIASAENYDLIHAHDWLSFPAGLAAKQTSKKPLVVHVHSTEFDRTGGDYLDGRIYQIEKQGLEGADRVVAVSNFTKQKIVKHYGIDQDKISVVHNGIDCRETPVLGGQPFPLKGRNRKVVLFIGRLTIQKGPDYFLKAAKKILDYRSDVFFVMAGSGDMQHQLIEEAVSLGIIDNFLFTGFIRGEEWNKAYQMADLFVMPSVSEPFGLTPLESLVQGTPVLISNQSGVSETLSHALKVDFWDTDEMANKIISVLDYRELANSLKENGQQEIKKINWRESAQKCLGVYKEVLSNFA